MCCLSRIVSYEKHCASQLFIEMDILAKKEPQIYVKLDLIS